MEETALAFTDFASYCLTNLLFLQNSLTSLTKLFFKFPWPISKFPDFSLTLKKIHFSDFSLTVGTLGLISTRLTALSSIIYLRESLPLLLKWRIVKGYLQILLCNIDPNGAMICRCNTLTRFIAILWLVFSTTN